MIKRSSFLSALLALLCISGCEWLPRIPLYWKVYEHPTYGFSLKVPRMWDIEPAHVTGAQIQFLASEQDSLFRANVNIVVQGRPAKLTLEQLAWLSYKQLSHLLKEYQLLSKGAVQLGNLSAFELRGRYKAGEGLRIIRSIVGVTDDKQFVFTFSCREEREQSFQPIVKEMIASFKAPTNLR